MPVWALDAAAVDPAPPGLGIGLADGRAAPPAGVARRPRPPHRPRAAVRDAAGRARAGPSTATVVLYALGVAGVPQIHIDEALWIAADCELGAVGGR